MAVKRYVGDKIVGLNSEKAAVLDTVSDGALYYTNDSPYVVYLKKDGAWQQISSSAGGGSELTNSGQILHRDIHVVSGDVALNTADIDIVSGDLLNTGQILHRDIHVVSGDVALNTADIDIVSGRIDSNDTDITSLTTNLDTTGNLLHRDVHVVSGRIATDSTLGNVKFACNCSQSTAPNIFTDTTDRSYAVTPNSTNQMVVNVPWIDSTANLNTTGNLLHRDVHVVSGRIDSNDTDITNLTTNLDTTGNLLHRDVHVVSGVAHGKASDVFKTISVQNEDDVIAAGATDTLTFVAGSNTTISTDCSNQTITINSAGAAGGEANVQSDWTQSSNTSDAFILNKPGILGVSSNYAAGSLLPAGASVHGGNFLRKDGSWAIPFTLSAATNSALGGIKLVSCTEQTVASESVSSTANRSYAVQLDSSNQAVVNVPWSDTNTWQQVSASHPGYVAQLPASHGGKFLKADGSWEVPAYDTTNTTYTVSIPNSTTKLRLAGSDSTTDDIEFVGAGLISVARTNDSKFTISTTATNNAGTVTSVTGGTGLSGTVTGTGSLSLDTATSTALGGIKVGSRLTITNGVLSADLQTDNNTTYGVSAVDDSGIKLRLTDSGSTTDDVKFAAGNLLGVAKVSSEDTICFTTTATANDTDANLKNRANHTGSQAASTISDFDAEVANNTTVAAHTTKLAGIEDGATADQTASEICSAAGITSALGTNAFNSTAFTTCEGTVESVSAGTGLTAGGTAVDPSLSLNKATSTALGGIKVSTGLTINASTGALSVTVPTANNFTNDNKTKLDNIEVGATADLTATEICALAGITGNIQSNAYTSTTIPTDNNQLANGCGYTTNIGTVTPSSSDTFTNKSGNISQWTNDANYSTTVGTVTAVTAASPLTATTGATPQISLPVSACVTINNLNTCGADNCLKTTILCSAFVCNSILINSGLFHGGAYTFTGNINTSGTLNHGTNHWIKTNMLCTCGTNACIVSDGGSGLIKGCFSGDGSAITNLDIGASDLPNIAKCEGTVTSVGVGAGLCLHSTANSFTVSDTICNTDKGSSQNIFKNIGAYNGATLIGTVTAAANNDTVCFVQGSNITLTHATDKITIAADNTTYNQATDSALGLVKLSGTPADNVTDTAITSNYIFDNLKTAVPANAVFTDTCYSQANSSTLGLVKISDSASNNASDTAISADWAYETLTIPSLNILGNNTGSAAEASGLTCAQVLNLLGVAAGATACEGTVTSVSGGTGLSGTVTGTGSLALNQATTGALGGIIVGTGLSVNSGTVSVAVPTANDFTTTLKNKLDGICAGATVGFTTNGAAGYVCPASTCTNFCASDIKANKYLGCGNNNCVDVTTVKASTLVDVSSGTLSASCIDVGTQTATGAITGLKLCGAGTGNCVEAFCGKFTFLSTVFSMTALQLCATGPNNCVEASCLKGDYDAADLTGTIDAARLPDTAKCQGDITEVTAGTGLTGGGSTGNISVCLDLGDINDSTTNSDGACFAVVNSSNVQKLLAKGSINISGFNNDSNFTSNTGTLTSSSNLNASRLASGTVDAARLPIASTSCLGGVKFGCECTQTTAANVFTECANRSYAVTPNSTNQMLVNVPWTDTNTFRNVTAGGNTLGSNESLDFIAGTRINITESGGNVTISTTATNNLGTVTSVTAGNGLSGGTITGSGTISLPATGPGAATYGSTATNCKINTITLDAYGRVTALTCGTVSGGTGGGCGCVLDKEANSTGHDMAVYRPETTDAADSIGCVSKVRWNSSTETLTIGSTTSNTVGELYVCGRGSASNCWQVGSVKMSSGALSHTSSHFCLTSDSNQGFLNLYNATCSGHPSISQGGILYTTGQYEKPHWRNSSGCYEIYMTSVSDYRFKQNLRCWSSICCTTDVVKNVPVYSFNWNSEGLKANIFDSSSTERIGFLAHEVKEKVTANNLVTADKDGTQADGKIIPQTINHIEMIPILWSALQETIKKVEDLEERVKTLESS